MSTSDDPLHAMMSMVSKIIETQAKASGVSGDDLEIVIVAAMRGSKHVSVAGIGNRTVELLQNALDNVERWKDVTDEMKTH